MLSNRDINNIRQTFENLVEIGSTSNDPSTITFHKFTRTDNDTSVGRYLDNAAYDLYAEDQGYTSSETTLTVPCRVVPETHTLRITDFGYEESSELEVEISPNDLVTHGIKIGDIAHSFEYITINMHDEVGLQGRASSNKQQLWTVTSVRPLIVAGGREVFGVRVGLKLTESDMSQLSKSAIGV